MDIVVGIILMVGVLYLIGRSQRRPQLYPTCSVCGSSTSMAGNLTNMYALGFGHDPEKFSREHGMMCAEHSGQLTERLLSEGRISEEQLKMGNDRAMEFMVRKLSGGR